jgi:hypothetical protein
MSDTPPGCHANKARPLPEHYVTIGKAKDGAEPGTAFPHVLTFATRYPMGNDTPIGATSNK